MIGLRTRIKLLFSIMTTGSAFKYIPVTMAGLRLKVSIDFQFKSVAKNANSDVCGRYITAIFDNTIFWSVRHESQ